MIVTATFLDASEIKAVDRLRSIWQPGSRPDVKLILLSMFKERKTIRSKKWVGVTPFVTARHHRKGRSGYEEWLKLEIIQNVLLVVNKLN
ncbi:MAG: hypothetical protein PVI90_15125 [Desulfobacteraceae bacterium]|jgi:CRISPR-associated protein Csb2